MLYVSVTFTRYLGHKQKLILNAVFVHFKQVAFLFKHRLTEMVNKNSPNK